MTRQPAFSGDLRSPPASHHGFCIPRPALFIFFPDIPQTSGAGKWPRRAYPVKESQIMIRQLGPLSAVAIHRRSSLMQKQEITLG